MKKLYNISWILMVCIITTFSSYGQDFEADSYIEGGLGSFAEVDFNNDGKPDIIGYSFSFSGPSLDAYINISDDEIKFETINISSSEVFNGNPAIGDIDGDGDLDIAVSINTLKIILILRNNGDNTFTQEETGFYGVNRLKFLDLEGDGDMDLIGYVFNDNIISTFINDGNGNLNEGSIVEHGNDISFVDYGDIDEDGDQDIVLSVDKFSGETVAVYLNDSLNNFTKLTSFDVNALNSAVQVKMIDINKDGKLDVLGLNDDELVAFIQNDAFGFVAQELVNPSNGGILSRFEIADFDGDGSLDVVIGDHTEDMRWYKNEGLIFTQHEVSSVRPVYNLLSADFDQDGDIDFVVSNGDFRAYRNEIEQLPSAISRLPFFEINVHPNPVQDYLTIKGEELGISKAIIYNNSGSKVYETQINIGNNKVNVSTLDKGFYLLSLQNKKSQILTQKKIIKI